MKDRHFKQIEFSVEKPEKLKLEVKSVICGSSQKIDLR